MTYKLKFMCLLFSGLELLGKTSLKMIFLKAKKWIFLNIYQFI